MNVLEACHMLTPNMLLTCLLSSNADFFQSLLDPNSNLHRLLPAPRDHSLVAILRASR